MCTAIWFELNRDVLGANPHLSSAVPSIKRIPAMLAHDDVLGEVDEDLLWMHYIPIWEIVVNGV